MYNNNNNNNIVSDQVSHTILYCSNFVSISVQLTCAIPQCEDIYNMSIGECINEKKLRVGECISHVNN